MRLRILFEKQPPSEAVRLVSRTTGRYVEQGFSEHIECEVDPNSDFDYEIDRIGV